MIHRNVMLCRHAEHDGARVVEKATENVIVWAPNAFVWPTASLTQY
jgi:hypothetical protein